MTVMLAGILVLAVALAWIRLLLWQRRAPSGLRAHGWRLATLVALQPVAAALLYATLLPPGGAGGSADTLVVATAGSARIVARAPGERLVALPEAHVMGADRAPDLGSELRRNPGIRGLRIVGSGLEPRDRDAAAGMALRFDPPAEPRGLVALQSPAPVPAGGVFRVPIRDHGMAGGSVELLDPALRIVDVQRVSAAGETSLSGTARAAGVTLFTLRVRDARRTIVSQVPVPVWTIAAPSTHVRILAGAPGPEVKYLRRWATDAGLAPEARYGVGGGASLQDAQPMGALAGIDAMILDDRVWSALGDGERQAIVAAVRGGMGLLIRLTGPVPRGWTVLGLTASGASDTAAVILPPPAASDEALAARRGPGTRDAPASIAGARDTVPALTRQAVTIGGGIPMLRDAQGTVLAAWRPAGRGRIGFVTLQDSFALVTAGHTDLHAEIWSALVGSIARPRGAAPATLDAPAFAGQRMAICGAGDAVVTGADGTTTRLRVDPATGSSGCAGYWPGRAGWYRLSGTAGRPFYVHGADALPDLRAAERRDATLRLVGTSHISAGEAVPGEPGSSWPWFAGWLGVVALLWWLERARAGRGAPVTPH